MWKAWISNGGIINLHTFSSSSKEMYVHWPPVQLGLACTQNWLPLLCLNKQWGLSSPLNTTLLYRLCTSDTHVRTQPSCLEQKKLYTPQKIIIIFIAKLYTSSLKPTPSPFAWINWSCPAVLRLCPSAFALSWVNVHTIPRETSPGSLNKGHNTVTSQSSLNIHTWALINCHILLHQVRETAAGGDYNSYDLASECKWQCGSNKVSTQLLTGQLVGMSAEAAIMKQPSKILEQEKFYMHCIKSTVQEHCKCWWLFCKPIISLTLTRAAHSHSLFNYTHLKDAKTVD